MKISIDYEVLIQEIEDELREGTLLLSDTIQVLRDTSTVIEGYKTIIDWYYNEEKMTTDMKSTTGEEDYFGKVEATKLYKKDKELLLSIKAEECLSELKEYNRVL